MKIHMLVEGPSEKVFLELWTPRFLPDHELRVHPHQGKGKLPRANELGKPPDPKRRGLLDQLPAKLSAFGKSADPRDECIVVLIDADTDDPTQLRDQLDELLSRLDRRPAVKFCLAIEELEAFYLGDLKALKSAYPNHNHELARTYVPDSICNTWEVFGKVIGDDGGNKVAWAETMGPKVTTKPKQSRSPSFKAFCGDLESLTQSTSASPTRQRKPRKAGAATPKDASGKRRR